MRADPWNDIAVEQLRRVLWEREKNLEMAELLRNALRRLPQSTTILSGYGYVCYWWGYYGEAMKSLEEALRLDPSDLSAMGNYHYCLSAQERIAEALALSSRARGLAPFSPEPYFYATFQLGYRLNRYAESIAMADRAIELEDLGFVHIVKARCLHALGRYSEAVEEYRKSLAVPPTRKASRAWLASVLEKLGRREEAFNSISRRHSSDQLHFVHREFPLSLVLDGVVVGAASKATVEALRPAARGRRRDSQSIQSLRQLLRRRRHLRRYRHLRVPLPRRRRPEMQRVRRRQQRRHDRDLRRDLPLELALRRRAGAGRPRPDRRALRRRSRSSRVSRRSRVRRLPGLSLNVSLIPLPRREGSPAPARGHPGVSERRGRALSHTRGAGPQGGRAPDSCGRPRPGGLA